MTQPQNLASITKWIEEHRADVLPQWSEILEGDNTNRRFQSFISLILMGFDAGRVFERENPDQPIPVGWDSRHLPSQA